MEIQVHKRLTLLLVLAAVLAVQPASARPPKKEKADSLVRLMKAESLEQLMINGQQYRKAISSTFLHNGTYLISDTALWNVDTKVINAVGHVKVIQDETVLTSDKLDYLIDDNLAQFRGTLVQLQNKKKNLLRTKFLDYNTRDSMAVFYNGASMRDEDGQVIESLSGKYSTDAKMFIFDDQVNMFSDSMFVKTNKLFYYSELDKAEFPVFIDFWKGGNMLSAEKGWYDKGRETVFFERNVHAMSKDQEAWSDSLYFYRGTGDLLMLGHAQVQDPGRDVTAVAERVHYNDTLSQVKLQRNAAVVLETGKDEKRDTIYMGADTLIYRTIRRCDLSDGTVKACEGRLADILTDPVNEYRRKAAEEAAAAAAAASQPQGGPPAKKNKEAPADEKVEGADKGGGAPAKGAPSEPPADKPQPPVETPGPPADTSAVSLPPVDSSGVVLPPVDSAGVALPPVDSLAAAQARKDSLFAPLNNALAAIDSLAAGAALPDSLAAVAPPSVVDMPVPADTMPLNTEDVLDSLPQVDTVQLDTTKIGFVYGIRNVRVFRDDIQMRCDSMVYCDLDSIARFYMDPVVWNDGRRQYTADSLFILVGGGGPRKASLQSNAFVVIQEDEVSYDQIKGTEILAYFDSLDSSLKRFDALGGSSAIFYLRENEAFATVNKVESKMLSGLLVDGDIDHVYYFENPKNNAYPVVQLPESERKMKGFSWRPEERPTGPEDITKLTVKSSQRSYYESKSRPEFRETAKYFPGYISGILREIAVRDSLAKLPKPKLDDIELPSADSLSLSDSLILPVRGDSLLVRDSLQVRDSLVVSDSLAVRDTLAVRDSLAADAKPAPKDSISVKEEIDPLSIPTIDPKQKRKEERELRRKLRIAARDARIAAREARWAELDRQDSLKLEAKKQKELEKQRAKTLKTLKAIQKQDAKDAAKLQKYIEIYRKKYEREQKRKAARERSQATGGGGEIPAPPESGEQAPGGDAILGDDGPVDDDSVLGRGRLPGA